MLDYSAHAYLNKTVKFIGKDLCKYEKMLPNYHAKMNWKNRLKNYKNLFEKFMEFEKKCKHRNEHFEQIIYWMLVLLCQGKWIE